MKSQKNIPNKRPLNFTQATEKRMAENSHLFFTQMFFFHRQNAKFKVNWHHHYIADVLQEVIDGKRKNVVINVPPGSSKTEMAVINLIARGLALNPRARFLHLSYSDDLALQNSQTSRDLISSGEFQELWPMKVADDRKANKRWNVEIDGKPAGGVYAASAAGQVTGFRAGHMATGWQGALIIDDPIKPEDAFSEPKLMQTNRRLISTIKSRKAQPNTPIILIMQRVSEKDPTQFIKDGNLGGEWSYVVIPAVIDDAYIATLDPKYQKMIQHESGKRLSYWESKEPIEELLAMEQGSKTDQQGARMSRQVFSAQYQQTPVALGGNLIRGEWFPRYTTLPKILYRKIYADTAQKTAERNDRSVFECWGYGDDHRAYLLDLIKGKWEAPELERRAIEFWNKHAAMNVATLGQLRQMLVEDKASGTGLIQSIRFKNHIPIKGIERNRDKLTRVMDQAPNMEQGRFCLPENAPFVNDFIAECEAFTADDTHQYDDQIDPMLDAGVDMLNDNRLELWKNII